MKTGLMVLPVIILLCSFQSQEKMTEFEKKINGFLTKYTTDFVGSEERFTGEQNDPVLEDKAFAAWEMIATMESKKTFLNQAKQNVYQRVYFGFFQFKNAAAAQKAFDELMKCFGTDCQNIVWGETGKSVKTTPVIYIKTDKEIISCRISCENINDRWENIKEDIINTFGQRSAKVITADCPGKLNFLILQQISR